MGPNLFIGTEPREINISVNPDHRGLLAEVYNQAALHDLGVAHFGQANVSITHEMGVVRGLHVQEPPSAQEKYLVVLAGAIFNVCVDLRPTSFAKVHTHRIGPFQTALAVPEGFAHGFQSLEKNTTLLWFVSHPQDVARARALRHDDPALSIAWPLPVRLDLLSDRDRQAEGIEAFALR